MQSERKMDIHRKQVFLIGTEYCIENLVLRGIFIECLLLTGSDEKNFLAL